MTAMSFASTPAARSSCNMTCRSMVSNALDVSMEIMIPPQQFAGFLPVSRLSFKETLIATLKYFLRQKVTDSHFLLLAV